MFKNKIYFLINQSKITNDNFYFYYIFIRICFNTFLKIPFTIHKVFKDLCNL